MNFEDISDRIRSFKEEQENKVCNCLTCKNARAYFDGYGWCFGCNKEICKRGKN